MKVSLLLFGLFLLANIVFATGAIQNLVYAVCGVVKSLMPFVALLLLVLAGLAYAFGGFFGAEIKAKAIGYSMALITGAIVGFLLWAFAGPVVTAMWGPYGCP